MLVTIKIITDTAGFSADPPTELARVLRAYADAIVGANRIGFVGNQFVLRDCFDCFCGEVFLSSSNGWRFTSERVT